MCYYIDYVPWEAALRIFDIVLFTGTHVLFQVGLAVLYLNMTDIVATDNSEHVVTIVKAMKYDTNELLSVRFQFQQTWWVNLFPRFRLLLISLII